MGNEKKEEEKELLLMLSLSGCKAFDCNKFLNKKEKEEDERIEKAFVVLYLFRPMKRYSDLLDASIEVEV
jgi:Fe-S cluster assembly iron-binding protein IscA